MRQPQGAGAAAAGIGVSRLSGLARTALITNILGIGTIGDAFAAAMRIPNFLQNLWAKVRCRGHSSRRTAR